MPAKSLRYTSNMSSRLASFVLRCITLVGVSALMLVPTGTCICDEHDESPISEQHEPGCPKVRKLDRSAPPTTFVADNAACGVALIANEASPTNPMKSVTAVAHGPPRGRPLYISLHILLI